ncbi:MAG: alpha-amylase family glycosyl hydrolase [Spirochaetales bacterium]
MKRSRDELRITPLDGRPELLREFHVRRSAREKYRVAGPLYALSGNVVLADLQATRRLAEEMNKGRDLVHDPDSVVRAGDINAMGLIDEILHYVVELYRDQYGEETVAEAASALVARFGEERVDSAVRAFAAEFPPSTVYSGEQSLDDYLASEHAGRSGREVMLEEMLMLRLENENPAFSPFSELFADDELDEAAGYRELIGAVADHFADKPRFGPDDQPLVEMLRTPAELFPNSLQDQLAYIRERWGSLLGGYLFRLLRGMDVLREEAKAGFGGPGPTRVYRYEGGDEERYSPDRDWMPRLVLIAKSTLVWLDQLSRAYERTIARLDQIPDEELDRLAGWGFTGLWLIGIWERSAASKRIKNVMGNMEAEASAYALADYEIAESLGGWDALTSLRERCEARGIRIASDMVPNHTGIDGRWVIEHPDWYVQLDHPPFPSYTYTGENLSGVPHVGIYLEDHYYSRSDAAVVFKRVDFGSGRERFIYHGNDGTSMPWNDTAQLDYLNPEVREAVIQTILHVARNFSVIRFDAAMTLAKRHIQRLWYPEPGHGGDIPSRAEHGMSADEFNARIPTEFWREVVDRVAAEVPDTLLLAEAFWMMEGYFVRTLGMHRVYNSAFMNMLKAEENAKYRQTIKNTIEFDKEILKRFVNFMNNPDEETAVAQFGKGDKYVGICTLMVTMPGLPMFGHGQIEGFTEKYGMEYKRAYLGEQPDRELVARHEAEIFPLMRRRRLFSGVASFFLYDLYTEDGTVNENVFAYSNSFGDDRALVLYNNAYERAYGWIKSSAGYVEKLPGGRKQHRRGELASALGLHAEHGYYCLLRDERNGLWFVRESRELHERGLFVDLSGYQSQVYVDIYETADNAYGHYAQLVDELRGRGVTDVEEAIRDIALKPLLDLYARVANSHTFFQLQEAMLGKAALLREAVARLAHAYRSFLQVGAQYQPFVAGAGTGGQEPATKGGTASGRDQIDAAIDAAVASFERGVRAVERLPFLRLETPHAAPVAYRSAVRYYTAAIEERGDRRDLLAAWLVLRPLRAVYESAAGICEEWGLITRAARAFSAETHDPGWVYLMKVLLGHGEWWERHVSEDDPLQGLMHELLSDGDVTTYLGFNRYEGEIWFNQERFEELRWWIFATALVTMDKVPPETAADHDRLVADVVGLFELVQRLERAQRASGFRVDALLAGLGVTNG